MPERLGVLGEDEGTGACVRVCVCGGCRTDFANLGLAAEGMDGGAEASDAGRRRDHIDPIGNKTDHHHRL